MPTADRPVVVVGGGIAGVACARRLADAGVPVRLLERSHRLGGRMAVRTEDVGGRSHPVDIGASYFTVRDERFGAVVEEWRSAGRAVEWTDTFYLSTPDGRLGSTTGPRRWSAPAGLRSLVEALADGLDVELRREVEEVGVGPDGAPTVDGEPARAVVLAMPDPQAADLLPGDLVDRLGVSGRSWAPTLCVWAAWPERWWPVLDGVFVDDSPVITWVADDGRRRRDDAPVLVIHTGAAFAEARLDDVDSGVGPVLAELPGVLGAGPMPPPEWARVHRWSLSAPRHPREAVYGFTPPGIGVCGDGWGPRSRVEQAWLSGHRLAGRLLMEFGAGDPAPEDR